MQILLTDEVDVKPFCSEAQLVPFCPVCEGEYPGCSVCHGTNVRPGKIIVKRDDPVGLGHLAALDILREECEDFKLIGARFCKACDGFTQCIRIDEPGFDPYLACTECGVVA